MHATFYIFFGIWYLNWGSWFTYNTFLLLVAPCVDERSPSVEDFSVSQRKTDFSQISVFSRIVQTIWYYFKTATNTTARYSFTAESWPVWLWEVWVKTVCRGFMWSLQGGEGHGTEISSSHGIVGKVQNNVQLVIQIWVINTSRWPNGPMWRQRGGVLLCFIYVTHTEGPHKWNFADY